MKLKDYMEQHPGENLSWCKPYTDEDGNALIMYEGEAIAYQINGQKHLKGGSCFDLEQFAREINPYHDDYKGYTDEHIALEMLRECGCASCPFRDECEAMNEDLTEETYL